MIDPGGSSDGYLAKMHAPAIPAAPVLSVSKSGNDAALSWTQVTTDTHGAPMTVSGHKLWSSVNPYFFPGDTSSPNSVYTGTNRAYTEPGVCASLTNYFYVVNALGPSGEVSVDSNRAGEFKFGLVKGQ